MTTGNEPINPTGYSHSGTGLTIREHFAAMAMQGFLTGVINVGGDNNYDTVATASVKYADALIAKLNEKP